MAKNKISKWKYMGNVIVDLIKNHWIKSLIIIIIILIGISGFNCEWGKIKIIKDPVIRYDKK